MTRTHDGIKTPEHCAVVQARHLGQPRSASVRADAAGPPRELLGLFQEATRGIWRHPLAGLMSSS
jgi:hypothetical protein